MTISPEVSNSKHEIDSLTSAFFRAVSFFEEDKPTYHNLYTLFIESRQLIKNSATLPEISTVRQFIEPRQSMVDSGELTDFKEVETAEITEIFGNVAHHFSTYEKYGINKGAEAAGASNEEIAERLVIAIGMVKRYMSNIFGKLTVSSRTQAVARAQSTGERVSKCAFPTSQPC